MQRIIDRHGFANFRDLHRWSIASPDEFWREAWDDLGIIVEPGSRVSEGDGFEGTRWFPDAQLNIVDTLLRGDSNDEVMVSLAEDSTRISLTRGQLTDLVAACAAALRAAGKQ